MTDLKLDEKWDLTLNSVGDLEICKGSYATAQEVANQVRLFTNDAYYNTENGIPHFIIDLGQRPLESLVKSRIRDASLLVDNVADVNVKQVQVVDRVLKGKIELTLKNKEVVNVNF